MATMMIHGHAVSIVVFLTISQFQNIAFKADILALTTPLRLFMYVLKKTRRITLYASVIPLKLVERHKNIFYNGLQCNQMHIFYTC
jgi:hypothetical protein